MRTNPCRSTGGEIVQPSPMSWPGMGMVMRRAFREQKHCLLDVHTTCSRYLKTLPGTPSLYSVRAGGLPRAYYAPRRNLFSALFLAVYHMLDVPEERRLLYGRLNQLFRIWVTSADNLLDDEDKVVIPVEMSGTSRVMRQVVTVMAADRALTEILHKAVEGDVITRAQSDQLAEHSLRILLPSAAQEATEEGGITERPDPEYVLWTIHRYKTGLLFHIPFLGIDHVEAHVDRGRCKRIRDALLQFGLGCQLMDDIRDMARDLKEGRHNYLLSVLAHDAPERLAALEAEPIDAGSRLYLAEPRLAATTAARAVDMLRESLLVLGRCGLRIHAAGAERMARSMLGVLDLGDLRHA